jgi:hypothetical protein
MIVVVNLHHDSHQYIRKYLIVCCKELVLMQGGVNFESFSKEELIEELVRNVVEVLDRMCNYELCEE